ncbi:MAG TPA: hypothetical protein VKC53_02190 [Patescibacteria group bacterium]|nr:hypothetical protein [Patescibacteria group bacterium]
MLKGFNKWLRERNQKIEANRLSKQEQDYQDSPYAQLLESRRRLGIYMNNPDNFQKVSELQGRLLEANGGLVVGLPEEEKPSLRER